MGSPFSFRTTEDARNRLIGLIYDCAVTPSRTADLLRSLADLFGAHFADSFTRDHDRSHAAGLVHGLDRDDYLHGMIGTWSVRNPWSSKAPVLSAGEVRATWQFLDPAELRNSQMFADYLDRRDLHEGLRFEVWSDANGIEDISLLRSFSAGPFTPDEIAQARALMPHLQRATELRYRLQRAELVAQASVDALAALDHGIIFVDQSGRPTFLNPAAAALLAEADAVAAQAGQLRGATAAATRQLSALLHRATLPDGTARAGAMRLPSGLGRPLSALVMPVRWDGAWPQPGQPAAIICLSGGRPNATGHGLAPLTAIFGLTAAETRLAALLLSGQSLAEIADTQNRSLATVRSHLARLMAKTETTRQSELLRCLGGVPRLPDAQPFD